MSKPDYEERRHLSRVGTSIAKSRNMSRLQKNDVSSESDALEARSEPINSP